MNKSSHSHRGHVVAVTILALTTGLLHLSAGAQNTPFDKALQDQAPAAPAKPPPPKEAPPPAPRKRPTPARHTARAVNQTDANEPASSCRNVSWKRGDIIRLQAQPYKQIHVSLPENGIDVIMGDKELWALDWINNRIFLKPTSRSSEGRSTTISAIGQSGNAYEFVVTRVSEDAEIVHCVYVNAEGALISRAGWPKQMDREQEITTTLGREIVSLRERNDNLGRQSREDMKTYRKKVNTNYAWSSNMFSRWNGGEVESVYDDGRFTYVRMKEDGQGLASIMAEIDGKAELLEYGFDEPSRTYQISGIFPKLTLRAGAQSMSITRKSS